MKFSNPGWLLAGLLACIVLVWMWRRYDARQHAALARFVSAHLRPELTQSISAGRRRLRRGLLLTALALLFVALAGPLVGYRWEQISRRGNEIVFAIDTSRSMSTPDMKPNRLTRAKLAIDDFANRLDGDAVGIVAFAGSAFLVCPITLDYGAFHESLGAIDTNTIPRGGTNMSSAIEEAQAALRRRPGSDKILILVTDGEDLEGSALATAKSAAGEDGLKIYTVGVGTPSGDLIPIPPDQGGGFVKDESGGFVKSRLDEPALKAIATATGGFYVPLGTQGEGLETIFKTVLGPLAKHNLASRQQKLYIQRYQWPLAGALGALLVSLLIGTRKSRGSRRTVTGAAASLGTMLLMVLTSRTTPAAGMPGATTPTATVPATSIPAAATPAAAPTMPIPAAVTPAAALPAANPLASPAPSAAAVDDAGRTLAAVSPQDPKKQILEFNAGTAAYKAGQFPQAAQAFQQSISHAPSSDPNRLADQQDAYYDLGNTLYRTGQKTEKAAPQETLQKWKDAVKAYETALQLRPNDADSKYNRDLVKRKIDQLQQQQNPDQNQGKGQGQGQGKGQGQGQGQNQQQNKGQGQPPSQGQPPPQGQSPSPPQDAKNGDPKEQPPQSGESKGEQPPPSAGQPPSSAGQSPQNAGQPPPGAGQPPPSAGQAPATPGNGQPQRAAPGGNPDQQADAAARAADNQHLPGQMSREEARELLDSVKGDERHALGAPLAQRELEQQPDKPYKNW